MSGPTRFRVADPVTGFLLAGWLASGSPACSGGRTVELRPSDANETCDQELMRINGARRSRPYDVGAYQSDGRASNPGWKIAAGFRKR